MQNAPLIAMLLATCGGYQHTPESISIQTFLERHQFGRIAEDQIEVAKPPQKWGSPKVVVAYISNDGRCGTGGCTLVMMQETMGKLNIIGKTTTVQLPITYLGKSANGYPIFGVWVRGGGVIEGYQAALEFDGHTYPRTPSAPPAYRISSAPSGKVLIPKPGSR